MRRQVLSVLVIVDLIFGCINGAKAAGLSAFTWSGNKEVMYIDGSGHVHELMMGDKQHPNWSDFDLSSFTNAPPARRSALAGFTWGQNKEVVFIDNNGHVHEMMAGDSQHKTWSQADLTSIGGGAAAAGTALAAYNWNGNKQVVYLDGKGHIHELMIGDKQHPRWSDTDLTSIASAPPANGTALGVITWSGNKEVMFLDGAGHVHEMMMGDKQHPKWSQADITAISGAPAARASAMAAFTWGDDKEVVILDAAGQVHELTGSTSTHPAWQTFNLSQIAKAPTASGSTLCGYSSGSRKSAAFTDHNGDVWQLSVVAKQTWEAADLTHEAATLPASGWELVGYPWQQDQQFAYRAVGDDIRELSVGGQLQRWTSTDLTGVSHGVTGVALGKADSAGGMQVRISGYHYLSLATPDPHDGASQNVNGWMLVGHDPGCGIVGNDGTDQFFGPKHPLPQGCSVSTMEFQEYWPAGLNSSNPGGVFNDQGSYNCTADDSKLTVRWHNTCQDQTNPANNNFTGKWNYYRVSFIVNVPASVVLADDTFDPMKTASNPINAPSGYADHQVPGPPPTGGDTGTKPPPASGCDGVVYYENSSPATTSGTLEIQAQCITPIAANAQGSGTMSFSQSVTFLPSVAGPSSASFVIPNSYKQGTWQITKASIVGLTGSLPGTPHTFYIPSLNLMLNFSGQ